ncbi:MAG: PorV/PorQ family protein [Bacteroidota bacterium]|nr:PorV/PorQ family protein [Bacteroidota bacterium]
MILRFRYIIFVLAIFLSQTLKAQILPSFGNSRTGTTALQFLKIAPDARSSALSGSYNALVNDVSAVFWNPAGLTHIDSNKYHFQLGHTAYYSGIVQNYMGFAFSKSRLNYWGISIINLSSGEMPVTTEFQPFGNGQTFSVSNMLVGVSFAKILSDNFSFGISGKYVYENISDVLIHNGIFDFGFIYNIGIKHNTRFAVGISNFGFNVSPSGNVTISTLNGDKAIENFENVAVPSIFRLGFASNVWNKGIHSLVFAGQLSHPTDNNETMAFGVEYSLKDILFLRTGYEFGADQNGLPSAGIGINLQRYFGSIKVDYGFNNKDILGDIHRITLGISLK